MVTLSEAGKTFTLLLLPARQDSDRRLFGLGDGPRVQVFARERVGGVSSDGLGARSSPPLIAAQAKEPSDFLAHRRSVMRDWKVPFVAIGSLVVKRSAKVAKGYPKKNTL